MFNSVFSFVWCLLTFWEAPTGKGNHVIYRTDEEPKVVINTLLYKSKQQLKGNLVSLFQAWKNQCADNREMQDWDGEQGGQNKPVHSVSTWQLCSGCLGGMRHCFSVLEATLRSISRLYRIVWILVL